MFFFLYYEVLSILLKYINYYIFDIAVPNTAPE